MKQKSLKIDLRYLGGNIACLSVDSESGEPVHNDIDNEEAIIIFNSLVGEKEECQTVKTILKENKQLKEQLERVEKANKEAIEFVDKELEEIGEHQYAIGKRRLNKIKNILDTNEGE